MLPTESIDSYWNN